MSKLVFNRDGGKTDEFGHLLILSRAWQGEVVQGLDVTANGTPNMTVNVAAGTGKIPTGTGGTAYDYHIGLDGIESVTIPTANASNPRNDLIVAYVDKAITPSQSFTNNSNNMLKLAVVSGAPATTPADPNVAAIQAAINAANPYIVLARVVVGAGVTQISAGNITDLRNIITPATTILDKIINAAKGVILPIVYPVGSVYTNAVDSTNPATLLGFGTWTAFAAGRVPVGIDPSQTEFNTIGKTGGEKAHLQTQSEVAPHIHRSGVAPSADGYPDANGFVVGGAGNDRIGGGRAVLVDAYNVGIAQTATPNLQPYITVYMWRRTA